MYGDNIPIDLVVNVRNLRNIHSEADGILHARATLNLKFYVEQKTADPILAADMELIDSYITANVTIQEGDLLNIELKKFNFTEIECNMATFGVTYNQFIVDAMNVLMDPRGYVLPYLN